MKTSNQWRGIKFVVGMVALCGFAISAQSTVLIDEVFDTGYNRTVNNIAAGNMALYKSRFNDGAIVNVGSVSFSSSVNNGAECYRAYFTDVGANLGTVGLNSSVTDGHVLLGAGDTLIASVKFYYGTVPSDTSTAAIRFGLFDAPAGRSMNDLNGGASTSAFTNNPGYGTFFSLMNSSTNNGISTVRRTNLTTTGYFGTSGDYTAIDGSIGGVSTAQSSGQELTLRFSITREGDGLSWILRTGLYDTLSDTLLMGGQVTDTVGVSVFNSLAWRVPRMPDTAGNGPYTFTGLKIEVVPEPSTLMLAGAGLAMAFALIRRRRS
jgi:hypothetical protein